MEAEKMVHKKAKKRKKNNKHLAVKLTEYQTCEEISLHQKKKKKKKVKGRPSENDSRAAEVHVDKQGKKTKKKSKHKGVKVDVASVVCEFQDIGFQERAVTKKRINIIEEPEHSGGNVGRPTETLIQEQTNGEAVKQKSVSEPKKLKKNAHTLAATDTQHHPDKVVRSRKSLELNIKEGILQEINEYLPNLKKINRKVMNSVIRYDLPRFREFKEQGIPIRTGMFTMAEKKRLKQNVEDFLALSGIESATKLFLPHRFPDQMDIIRLKRRLQFMTCLCAGISRTWSTIIRRARDLFNQENYLGRFTEKENKDLMNLHKLYGPKWAIISEKMGRSQTSVNARFYKFCDGHGPWTEEEFRSLLSSVQKELLKRATPGEDGSIGSAVIRKVDLYKQLPWTTVKGQVRSRSVGKCRNKWMAYLKNKMTTGGVITSRKSLESEIQLIKAINEMNVEDAAEIVWDDLTHLFGNAPTPYLQMRLHRLKVSHVPGWSRMTDFCEIIDYLYEKTLPNLQEKLRNCKEEEEEPTEERDSYKLSEIFPDLP